MEHAIGDSCDRLVPQIDTGVFKMYTTTDVERWRADTFWDKEPETILWIGSFVNGECFWDIGANIGIYSLFACSRCPNSAVYAFEPVAANATRLRYNAALNKAANLVVYQIAISSYPHTTTLRIPDSRIGASGATIGNGDQVIACHSVDSLLREQRLLFPTHIKIDTDGGEWEIVRGMKETLNHHHLQSVLIEINDHYDEIVTTFESCGFTTDNRFNSTVNHSRIRRSMEGIQCENVIFTRRVAK